MIFLPNIYYSTVVKFFCRVLLLNLVIDAENGGVFIQAYGCEKYMQLLKYGQYGQVGVDGVWREKTNESEQELEHSAVQFDIDIKDYARLIEFLATPKSRKEIQEFFGYKSRDHLRKKILIPLIESGKIDLTIPDKPQSSKQRYVWHRNK